MSWLPSAKTRSSCTEAAFLLSFCVAYSKACSTKCNLVVPPVISLQSLPCKYMRVVGNVVMFSRWQSSVLACHSIWAIVAWGYLRAKGRVNNKSLRHERHLKWCMWESMQSLTLLAICSVLTYHCAWYWITKRSGGFSKSESNCSGSVISTGSAGSGAVVVVDSTGGGGVYHSEASSQRVVKGAGVLCRTTKLVAKNLVRLQRMAHRKRLFLVIIVLLGAWGMNQEGQGGDVEPPGEWNTMTWSLIFAFKERSRHARWCGNINALSTRHSQTISRPGVDIIVRPVVRRSCTFEITVPVPSDCTSTAGRGKCLPTQGRKQSCWFLIPVLLVLSNAHKWHQLMFGIGNQSHPSILVHWNSWHRARDWFRWRQRRQCRPTWDQPCHRCEWRQK